MAEGRSSWNQFWPNEEYYREIPPWFSQPYIRSRFPISDGRPLMPYFVASLPNGAPVLPDPQKTHHVESHGSGDDVLKKSSAVSVEFSELANDNPNNNHEMVTCF
jgi:hypothetical protein